ncbi:MAG TPA: PDZ domain-containing protein [Planctomycetaceae bacterium]|nr:PDZ domain-containing protein [Planctomycetaceae bacterium]HIQ21321.1 PDZ domain-containing protein [Planctomycetota bacterium]
MKAGRLTLPSLGSGRLWATGVLLGLALCGIRAEVARGQVEAIQAGIERYGPVTPEKRQELYQQLQSQAAVLEAQAAVLRTAAKLIGPTVVHIEADVSGRPALQLGRGRRVEEAGSGVIIAWKNKHYILTNRHVITGASPSGVKITLADGRQIRPERIWEDPDTDVAVMAVSAPELVAARLGNSDSVQIGDFVLAVGSPYGLSHSVTFGIVSATGRRDLELGPRAVRLQDFIQTDAAINPGNSGGPLVNLRGEVIGINTAIASNSGGSEGVGFAIPINMFMTVARQLIQQGKVSRAYLGVELEGDFTPAAAAAAGLPRPMGARITKITVNSPAQKAGLRLGDVILQYNQVPIEDSSHLINLVNLSEVGQEVTLVVFRDRKPVRIKVTLADRSKFVP